MSASCGKTVGGISLAACHLVSLLLNCIIVNSELMQWWERISASVSARVQTGLWSWNHLCSFKHVCLSCWYLFAVCLFITLCHAALSGNSRQVYLICAFVQPTLRYCDYLFILVFLDWLQCSGLFIIPLSSWIRAGVIIPSMNIHETWRWQAQPLSHFTYTYSCIYVYINMCTWQFKQTQNIYSHNVKSH